MTFKATVASEKKMETFEIYQCKNKAEAIKKAEDKLMNEFWHVVSVKRISLKRL